MASLTRADAEAPDGELWLCADDRLWLEPGALVRPAFQSTIRMWLASGALLGLDEAADTAESDRREFGPTHVVARAEFFTVFARDVLARLPARGSFAWALVDWALVTVPGGAGWLGTARRLLVLRPLADRLGLGRARAALYLGERVRAEAQALFAALELPLAPLAPESLVLTNVYSPLEAHRATAPAVSVEGV